MPYMILSLYRVEYLSLTESQGMFHFISFVLTGHILLTTLTGLHDAEASRELDLWNLGDEMRLPPSAEEMIWLDVESLPNKELRVLFTELSDGFPPPEFAAAITTILYIRRQTSVEYEQKQEGTECMWQRNVNNSANIGYFRLGKSARKAESNGPSIDGGRWSVVEWSARRRQEGIGMYVAKMKIYASIEYFQPWIGPLNKT
ncbi:uncharacterized protein CIMG_03125 [Coccidioides immitis RS]|uniref:Uncharacterized protein n=1 Tax=Coccidioides immitis (strain RS) TaxID=246410 RepID=A0A0E1RWI9_COCIM|nr:uncharacterized protein CIMG_03125 [Coccidioides immitis RS]EAS32101.2 hypothetical protein CIMG_03125 [Coccidioides immitis RS]